MPPFERLRRGPSRPTRVLLVLVAALSTPLVSVSQTVTPVGGPWRSLSLDPSSDVACGVTRVGGVACWTTGTDAREQKTFMRVGTVKHPRVVPHLDQIAGVAVAETFACAWRASGEIWCWGANDSGQLGDSTRVSRAEPRRVRTSVAAAYVGVSADGYACLLSSDGRVYCWGSGSDGQLGNGRTEGAVLVPTLVAGEHRFKSISVGADSHVCAIDGAGIVWCWGENGSGQAAGSTPGATIRTPQRVDAAQRFEHVSSGNSFTCAVDVRGQASCWGYNRDASLGVGDTTDHLGVQAVRSAVTFTSLIAGFRRVCATTASSQLVCWGLNDDGQIQTGGPKRVVLPTSSPLENARVSALGVGGRSTCILDHAWTIRCWSHSAR